MPHPLLVNFWWAHARGIGNTWLISHIRQPVATGDKLKSNAYTFEVEAIVHGYHIYKEIGDASIGEELLCAREPTNPRDPFVVAVIKYDQTLKCQNFRLNNFTNHSKFMKFAKLKTDEL